MLDYGLKISRDGFGIGTTDPRELVFSSGFETASVALQGSSQQTGNSGDVKTFTIAHGLAFIPFVLVYINTSKYPNNWKWCPFYADASITDFIGNKDSVYNTNIRIDATNLVVRVILANGSSDTITIKYYCLNTSI